MSHVTITQKSSEVLHIHSSVLPVLVLLCIDNVLVLLCIAYVLVLSVC